MEHALVILFGSFFSLVGIVLFPFIRRQIRRKQLLAKPLSNEWKEIIIRNVPIYRRLPDKYKAELHGLINIFMDEKYFEGCAGLEISDEIKLTIAVQACLLLIGKKKSYFPTLTTILVYPSIYFADTYRLIGKQGIHESSARLGESWTGGSVILAWDHVRNETFNYHNGHNVVLHEFAHQLDQEDGTANGLPFLPDKESYTEWAQILRAEYEKLINELQHGISGLIDPYGATNPAEFFAVITETFFEKPREMKNTHLKLYETLKKYYSLDPAEWI